MINVECDGCKSPYQVDERRVPAAGLKMRCSKCGNSILVQKPAAEVAGQSDLPVAAAPRSKGVAPVFPRGPVLPKPAPVLPKVESSSAEKAALAFARGEGSRFDFPALSVEEDPLGDLDLPSPATLVSKEKPAAPPIPEESFADLGLSEQASGDAPKRPSERPTAPQLPAVAVPKADVTQFARRDVEPPPRGKPTVRQMAAVAVAASKADLPSVVPSRDAIAPPQPQRSVVDLPSVATNPPAKQASVVDLPSPAKPAAKRTLEIDLSGADLPPIEDPMGFGDLDLPATVPAHAGARGFGGAGLPAPPPPREQAKSFGEIDLPAVPADLPAKPSSPGASRARSGNADLPMIGDSSFGEIDLPVPEPDGDDGGFGEFDLPAPEADSSFGVLDLPLPQGKSGEYQAVIPQHTAVSPAKLAPSPAAKPTAASSTFSAFGDLELPLTSESSMNLNAVVIPGAIPSAPGGGSSLDFALDDLSLDAPASKPKTSGDNSAPARGMMASIPGEEFSLGGQTNSTPPPAPRASDMTGGIGDEVELGAGEATAAEAAKKDKPAKAARSEAAAPTLSRKERFRRRALTMGIAVLVAVGGGSLALLPDVGPFGVYAVMDIVQADEQNQTLAQLEKNVQTMLDEDTLESSTRALNAAKAAQLNLPRHRATAAYTAYAAFWNSLHHGPRAVDETFGKQMLEFVGEASSRERSLATAAKHKAVGKPDAAKRIAKDLVGGNSKDIDALALMGEIELASGTKEDALAIWTRALEGREKSARALYGLARAQYAMGDAKNAEKNARTAIEVSPKHAGARILLATIISKSPTTEAEAIDLLNKVTTPGDVRIAASEAQVVQAYITSGRINLARSRISAASDAFAAALKIDPRNVEALMGDAELFFRSGRYSQALLRFQEAMKADESNVLAKVGAIKTNLALEKRKDAQDIAKKLRETKPELALGAYWLGRVEEANGNKKDAETLYLEAIKLGANETEIVDSYVSLVALLSATGRAEDAQAKLAEASAKFPNLAALHRAKGDVFAEAGRYAEARTEYEAALAKEDDLGTRFRLGETLRKMRLFDDAMAVLDKLQAADKDYPGLSLERGILYAEMGQSERALEMYNAALQKAPGDVDLKLRVGATQVIAGHPDEAEKILREVLKDRAASADANHFLGRALLLKGGATAEAIRFLDRATEIDANRAEYYLYVGWAANELNQVQRAEQAITRALELDRELADAYWQRAVLLHKQGRTLDALADLQVALEKRPSRFEAYATMALCYQDQARWPDAEKAWVKAIEGNNSVAEWHYRLGKIYESHGNRATAATELDKTIELIESRPNTTIAWHIDAYFLYGETMQSTGQKEKALKGYRRFLQLAPINNAYRVDAERAIKTLDPASARRP